MADSHFGAKRRVRHGRARKRRGPGLGTAAVRGFALLLLVAVCVITWREVSGGIHSSYSSDSLGISDKGFQFATAEPSYGIQSRNRRLVYPYSVIPGGVRSADELREVAKHDPVVAQHYAGFDYARARVIEVDRPKLVYLSYRRGEQVRWTSKQAMLRVGEKLLTDGRITARTRCGNQVSVLPQANTAPNEPTMAELERPDAVASGREDLFPEHATALNLDPATSIGPPYGAFPQPGGFVPLPISSGGIGPTTSGCPSDKKKKTTIKTSSGKDDCGTNPPPPPPTVPEPGTLILVLSGTAGLYARVRLRKRQ